MEQETGEKWPDFYFKDFFLHRWWWQCKSSLNLELLYWVVVVNHWGLDISFQSCWAWGITVAKECCKEKEAINLHEIANNEVLTLAMSSVDCYHAKRLNGH